MRQDIWEVKGYAAKNIIKPNVNSIIGFPNQILRKKRKYCRSIAKIIIKGFQILKSNLYSLDKYLIMIISSIVFIVGISRTQI